MTWRGSKLLKRTLQIGVVYVSLYTGLSRISDYKHHWSDVLAGFALGTLFALVNVRLATTVQLPIGDFLTQFTSVHSCSFICCLFISRGLNNL